MQVSFAGCGSYSLAAIRIPVAHRMSRHHNGLPRAKLVRQLAVRSTFPRAKLARQLAVRSTGAQH